MATAWTWRASLLSQGMEYLQQLIWSQVPPRRECKGPRDQSRTQQWFLRLEAAAGVTKLGQSIIKGSIRALIVAQTLPPD